MQGGSSKMMYSSIMDKIFTLPNDCKVYPAHDNKVRWTTNHVLHEVCHFFRIDKIFYSLFIYGVLFMYPAFDWDLLS